MRAEIEAALNEGFYVIKKLLLNAILFILLDMTKGINAPFRVKMLNVVYDKLTEDTQLQSHELLGLLKLLPFYQP